MTDGEWIAVSSLIVTIGFGIYTAINAWRNREIADLRYELRRSRRRERRCHDSLFRAYEWMGWAQQSMVIKTGAAPAPMMPMPQLDDDGDNDDEKA